MSKNKLTAKEKREPINMTLGRIKARAIMLEDKRLLYLIKKMVKDFDRLKII